ncbi:MAG: hypothetical protein ACXADH_00110 [Candidatus Kariarchaeaceae archaeon]|jgi:hypothetical protein
MRSVAICLVMLLAFVLIDSNANAQCFSSAAKIRSFGVNNVVVSQPVVQSVVAQPFVAQPFVAQQLVVPQSTAFFAGGNVAFLNAPAAVVSPVVVQQQRVAVRRGLFGRKQTVVVRQPRVQNIVVGQSRLLIK